MQLYDFIKAQLQEDCPNYIFIDEVQTVPEFQKAVNGLFVRKNCDVYITGSNAYILSGDLATLLSGRYVEIKMLPLSFKEYICALKEQTDLIIKYRNYLENSSFPYALELSRKKDIRAYLGSKKADMGHILENIVYLELLRRGYEVYTGKAGSAEVDFIAIGEDGEEYYQVAYTVEGESKEGKTILKRELAPLEAIRDHNPKYLLTMDFSPNTSHNGIKQINALDWLLN